MSKFPSYKINWFFSPENIEAEIDKLGNEYILHLPEDQKIFPLIAKKCT